MVKADPRLSRRQEFCGNDCFNLVQISSDWTLNGIKWNGTWEQAWGQDGGRNMGTGLEWGQQYSLLYGRTATLLWRLRQTSGERRIDSAQGTFNQLGRSGAVKDSHLRVEVGIWCRGGWTCTNLSRMYDCTIHSLHYTPQELHSMYCRNHTGILYLHNFPQPRTSTHKSMHKTR